jgi:hypothetical protein
VLYAISKLNSEDVCSLCSCIVCGQDRNSRHTHTTGKSNHVYMQICSSIILNILCKFSHSHGSKEMVYILSNTTK